MKKATEKKSLLKLGILLVAVIMTMAVIFTACGQQKAEASEPTEDVEQITESQTATEQPVDEQPADDQPADEQPAENQEEATEAPVVPLPTNYIVLSYPAELENEVAVTYENLNDGQMITFTTNFTGEELVLFRFSISASGDDGFALGVLKDEQAGDLMVCVHVEEYTNGNWAPEDFNKLNALQERVNDIIVQFYDDPRFVPNN